MSMVNNLEDIIDALEQSSLSQSTLHQSWIERTYIRTRNVVHPSGQNIVVVDGGNPRGDLSCK